MSNPAVHGEHALQQLVDRGAICTQLANHSRGIDRCDGQLLKSVYHKDATVDYGVFAGAAHEFCDVITESVSALPVTLHRTSNMYVALHGTQARSECYVIAYMAVPGAGGGTQALIQGRYLDRHACRQGVWKLTQRTYVLDWYLELPGTGTALPGVLAAIPNRGGKREDDPIHQNITAWLRSPPNVAQTPQGDSMTLSAELTHGIETALARNDIHDLIMAQARATDRGDLSLLQSVWHPGATVDIGFFAGSADDFCPMIIEATAGMQRMSHTVANEWIDVRGDEAVAESYVIAFTTFPDEKGQLVSEITVGRYFDRFARRDSNWKFTTRTFITDWQMRQPATTETPDGLTAQLTLRGSRGPTDPIYAHWQR